MRSVTSSDDEPLLKTQRARRRRRTRGQRLFSTYGRDGIDMKRPVEVESATAASAGHRPRLRQVRRRRPASSRRGELSQRGSRYRQRLAGPLSRRIISSGPGHCRSNPRRSAAEPISAGHFTTTKPARSRCSTSLFAMMSGHDLVGVVDPPAALKARREGERVGDVFSRGLYGRSRRIAAVADRDHECRKWAGKRALPLGVVSTRSTHRTKPQQNVAMVGSGHRLVDPSGVIAPASAKEPGPT